MDKTPHIKDKSKKNNITLSTITLICFVIIFMIIIPYWLSFTKNTDLFFSYITNIDIIASILTWRGSWLPNNPTLHLYNPTDTTTIGQVSFILINTYVLSWILYLMVYRISRSNFVTAWARTTISIIITYLIANGIVLTVMKYTYNFIEKYINNYNVNKKDTLNPIAYWITFCVGIILMIIIILTERYINTYFIKYLLHFFTPVDKSIQQFYPITKR